VENRFCNYPALEATGRGAPRSYPPGRSSPCHYQLRRWSWKGSVSLSAAGGFESLREDPGRGTVRLRALGAAVDWRKETGAGALLFKGVARGL
jgi:hypothetical protein